MNAPELGKVFTSQENRDAIHLALYCAQAGEKLFPGQKVILSRMTGHALMGNPEHFLGVVDPFLTDSVQPGEWFWICLRPGAITGLRHVYTCRELDGREANTSGG